MSVTVIRAKCVDQEFKIISAPTVASGGKNEDILAVEFCPLWDGFEKMAVFYRTPEDVHHAEFNENNECIVPWEELQEPGYLYMGVFGCKGEITKTSEVKRYFVKPGAITEATKPSEPSPNIYEQVLGMFIPQGGAAGQVLRKKSDKDFDFEWGEMAGGGGGNIAIDNKTLKMQNGVLAVNTTNEMERDNTLPITSAGVYATVGNIEVLLKTI